ncbi:dihydroorotase [Dyadobacter chenwenxiniae]|uniref:Dihydroorotase n=1 Tax=Dyadobacter chenwenxiniae TaxID=2906456 RepID=A0A9X1TDY7_9BACT|nr:dihydroorotase [Dyadobacter chenwenxiniae]MCF0061482.1 dihydroorotase [Dyadobacter chenwenxiniae]UON81305.1 dihydroorotase [Dyadobacter chenwenxiniae]
MKLLIRSVQIIDKKSPFNGQIKDVLIEGKNIKLIGDNLDAEGAEVKEGNGLCMSVGWVDMRVASRDPGFEHKEDLTSVRAAAAHGGFTEIVLLPNTEPVVHSKDTLNYIRQSGSGGLVKLHVAAAVTRKAEGVDFTEMIDLHEAGAIAFTDGEHPVQNADLFLKTILYLQPLNALLMNRPEDRQLTLYGQMHEGLTSTLIGMKGIPSLAEEMMLNRDLKLLEYALEKSMYKADSPALHVSLISTKRAVELIREAKKNGLPVSCDIAAHQLAFTDSDLIDFDTNLKVNPPFRSADDVNAIKEALADGTIDAIVSDHNPHDEESKNLEFDHADFGMTGLETAFSLALMHSGLGLEDIIEKFTSGPRRILRLQDPALEEGALANLTFFEKDTDWTFNKSFSKSKNTPFLGQELRGKVRGVVNNGKQEWYL